MLGNTLIMRDEDISIPFPMVKAGDEVQNTFAIHVTLSSHLGKILDGNVTIDVLNTNRNGSTNIMAVIYGVHNQRQCNFMVEVKGILSRLAETMTVLQEHLFLDLVTPTQPLSRDAATLHLLLHQVCRQQKSFLGSFADSEYHSVSS